jgi:hypothetical protein
LRKDLRLAVSNGLEGGRPYFERSAVRDVSSGANGLFQIGVVRSIPQVIQFPVNREKDLGPGGKKNPVVIHLCGFLLSH